jgi:hypothetical protein
MRNCRPWSLEEFQRAAEPQVSRVSDTLNKRTVIRAGDPETLDLKTIIFAIIGLRVPASEAYMRAVTLEGTACCCLLLPAAVGS